MNAETENGVKASMTEFGGLLRILIDDLRRCETLLNETDDIDAKQFYARAGIRTLFALFEGCIFRLKQMTVSMGKDLSFEFSPGDLVYLTENQPHLDENLCMADRRVTIPLQKNVRFAFYMFAKTCDVPFSLNTSSSGWNAFRRSIKIRDRLMHPKHESDTLIMEDEMRAASLASKWFIDSLEELFMHLGYPIATSDVVH